MAGELISMSGKEFDRLEVFRRVLEGRLTRSQGGEQLGLSERQVRRLCKALEISGPAGIASKKRGRPSNHRLPQALHERAVAIVRERYVDFGPTLANEKLGELHDVRVSRETLRSWMAAAGIWTTKRERLRQPHQPRHRRECLGELVQIDGCDHEWFENRGPRCSLLVYVDDATGNIMELRFVHSESAFDYFRSTADYLKLHGKPVAFYSDKHSIFCVHAEGTTGPAKGVTQFGRALGELNIDIICANTPQAKGRVERMNKTLQDRLVKELRLRGISSMNAGNAFLPEFSLDYNRRFARPPRSAHNAHRPLRADEDLARIFTWKEERTLSGNLTVHYKRGTYLIERSPENIALARKQVVVREWEDGRVEIHAGGRTLPYSLFDQNPVVSQGAVVENKRLGAVLSVIQVSQAKRDRKRMGAADRNPDLRRGEEPEQGGGGAAASQQGHAGLPRLRPARARADVHQLGHPARALLRQPGRRRQTRRPRASCARRCLRLARPLGGAFARHRSEPRRRERVDHPRLEPSKRGVCVRSGPATTRRRSPPAPRFERAQKAGAVMRGA
jgi:hypothetical protein